MKTSTQINTKAFQIMKNGFGPIMILATLIHMNSVAFRNQGFFFVVVGIIFLTIMEFYLYSGIIGTIKIEGKKTFTDFFQFADFSKFFNFFQKRFFIKIMVSFAINFSLILITEMMRMLIGSDEATLGVIVAIWPIINLILLVVIIIPFIPVPYLALEQSNLTLMETVQKSMRLMRGNKLRYIRCILPVFLLQLIILILALIFSQNVIILNVIAIVYLLVAIYYIAHYELINGLFSMEILDKNN